MVYPYLNRFSTIRCIAQEQIHLSKPFLLQIEVTWIPRNNGLQSPMLHFAVSSLMSFYLGVS